MWLEIRAANKRREAFHDGRNQGTIMEDEHTMAMAAAAKRSHTDERGYQRLAEPSIYSFGAPTPVPSAQRPAGSLSIIAATCE